MINRRQLHKLAYPTDEALEIDKISALKSDMDEFDFINESNTKEDIYRLGFETGVLYALSRLVGKVEAIEISKPLTTSDLTAEEQEQLARLESNE